jgi:hypothetical protein
MTSRIAAFVAFLMLIPTASAQNMRQIMLDLIHPASNDILLTVSRGGPSDEKEWASARHSALTLSESGPLLIAQGQSTSEAWSKAVKLLTDAGADAYKAAQAKDARALEAIAARIDASCTNCHKQYRPNVFPRQGASQ